LLPNKAPLTPQAMPAMRAGDWICPLCYNHNYADKLQCNRCGAPKAEVLDTSHDATPPGPQMRPGDWICPACNNHNFADKINCNKCGFPKQSEASGASAMPVGGKGKGATDVRPGDWMCPSCGNHNYASKTACNRCGFVKPKVEEEAAYGAAAPKMPPARASPYQMAQRQVSPGLQSGFQPSALQGYLQQLIQGAGQTVGQAGAGPGKVSKLQAIPAEVIQALPPELSGALASLGIAAAQVSGMAASPTSAKMRPGDWMCPVCGNHNYASKTHCNRCGIPKETRVSDKGFREGDWVCLSCANHNYASKESCNKCGMPKSASAVTPKLPSSAPQQHKVSEKREGDWMCPACGNHNYAKRMACNRCGAPKA